MCVLKFMITLIFLYFLTTRYWTLIGGIGQQWHSSMFKLSFQPKEVAKDLLDFLYWPRVTALWSWSELYAYQLLNLAWSRQFGIYSEAQLVRFLKFHWRMLWLLVFSDYRKIQFRRLDAPWVNPQSVVIIFHLISLENRFLSVGLDTCSL